MEKTNKKTDLKKPILSINQKIIFSFLLVFIFGLGLGAKASAATKLDVTDQGYIGKRIFATDGTSLYGISSTNTQIYKYSASDYSSVAGYDFGSGAIDRIFSTSVTDRIFIVWKDTSNIYTLYRSTDGGASVTPVCNLGYNSIDGHFANVTVLSRGFLEYDSSTYYFGEYNVNGTRISGSTNDTVRIMKSTDNGVTWTPVVTWNTNGANQVRHVHYVVKDPDIAGEIYIGTGDSAVQTGIIKWDVATGVWSDNKTLTELGSISGFTSLVGAMKYKGLDLLFSGNYIMTFADDSTASESGIWRCTKDLNPANYTSVDTQILSFPNRAGWTGLKTSSGNLIFADQLGTTATDRQINIYSSSDGGNTWTIVGKYGVIAGTVSYLNVMELNGKIYLSEPGGGSAGKGAGGTAIVS
ncbi:MAG TPA: hypothetical protein VK469_15640, partial [Candidatus Kapabacteria bacterium]|nr:hypothetical protein [Candidatus Kapabacteria bacterium]